MASRLLLLFRHSAKSQNAQDERLAIVTLNGDKVAPAARDSSEVARS